MLQVTLSPLELAAVKKVVWQKARDVQSLGLPKRETKRKLAILQGVYTKLHPTYLPPRSR
jgi:hypothetical protein